MVVVHRVFRRELVGHPRLVRGVTARRRRGGHAIVADNARLVLTGLQIHHTGEDVGAVAAACTRTTQPTSSSTRWRPSTRGSSHARTAGDQLVAWASPRDAATGRGPGDDAATRCDAPRSSTSTARSGRPAGRRRHLTSAEWQSVGEHGRESMTKAQLPLMFGAILEDADTEERATIYAAVPVPIRLFLEDRRRPAVPPLHRTRAGGGLNGGRSYTMDARADGVAATRERIVDAATTLFLEQAFEDVTLAAIAKAAGVSHQTVLNHFESKEGVVLAVAELARTTRRRAARDRPSPATSPARCTPSSATTSAWATPTSAGWRRRAARDRWRRCSTRPAPSHQQWLRRDVRRPRCPTRRPPAGAPSTPCTPRPTSTRWKLLRRDLHLSRAETEKTIVDLVAGILRRNQTR